jgi:hypothetical protein
MTDKDANQPTRCTVAVALDVRDELNRQAKEWGLNVSDTIARLLAILPPLKRAGIKIKHVPARTELEFPR